MGTGIESYGIGHIPESERTSRPRNIFYILLGSSLTYSIIIIGWFPISFGLSWWAGASALGAGALVGGALLVPMSLMGPRTGTNNPVSSGAHFGVVGRIIGSMLELLASLAFAALSIWTGGDALVACLRAVLKTDVTAMRPVAYAVLSVIVTVVSVYGHSTMLAAQKIMVPTAGIFMLIGVFVYAPKFSPSYPGTGHYALGSFWPTWMLSFLLAASTIGSYGPYVGDWARHIPHSRTKDRHLMLSAFLGGFFGVGVPFLWGEFTAVAAHSTMPYVFGIVAAAPLWYVFPLLFLGLAAGTAQATVNTYGTGLDMSSIVPKLNRVQATLTACVIATLLVYVGDLFSSVIDGISVFLDLLTVFSVPWIVIMSIGYVYRHGHYDIDDIQVFNQGRTGGKYWFTRGINYRAFAAWVPATAIGLLFTNTTLFDGPGARLFGGVDTGFLLSGVLAGALYFFLLLYWPEPAEVFAEGRGPRWSRHATGHMVTAATLTPETANGDLP